MHVYTARFSNSTSRYYFDADFDVLKELAPTEKSFIITDENLMIAYAPLFKPWKCIVIPAGEASKNLEILDDIIRQLIALEADRDAVIIGIGGGVVTDIAGFVAGIYKRGVQCVLVPTSILAMVDAAIGGKNGLDIGEFKNMMGLIRQPAAVVYHYPLLKALPKAEWINGFAEIIKHACILDKAMFDLLAEHKIEDFQKEGALLASLIERNAMLKIGVVEEDEMETGNRKMLNFGHTLGHAIENVYDLPHGHAVSIGMAYAAKISAVLTGFSEVEKLTALLKKYHLPVQYDFDMGVAMKNMAKDKKKSGSGIHYVLLESIGKAVIKPLSMNEIENSLSRN